MSPDPVLHDDRSAASPSAAVIVCTRDRGAMITATIQSILDNERDDVEVIVVDQSAEDDTRDAMEQFGAAGHVRYVRSELSGKARAWNLALSLTDADFLLCTDDDCVVDAGWIEASLAAFAEHPDAAIVFGDVLSPPDGDDVDGYAPESVADRDIVVRSMLEWKSPDGVNVGIGASLAIRNSVAVAVGGYDVSFGPGGKLKTADDTELSLRVLFEGHTIVHSTAVRVVHFGTRSHDDFRALTRMSMYAVGAAIGKVIRLRPGPMLWFTAGRFRQLVFVPLVTELAHLRRPPVLGRAVYLVRGIWQGLRLPLDRQTGHFKELPGS